LKSFKDQFLKLLNTYRNFIKWHKFFPGNYYFFRFVWFKFLGFVLHYDVLYLFKKNIILQDDSHEDMKEISCGEATQKDLNVIMNLNPNEPKNFIRKRLENKEICYVACFEKHTLCGYKWVAPGKRVFRYRGKKIFIDENDVYSRDAMTLPEYRGRGISSTLHNLINNELARKGKKIIWLSIKGWNYSSQRAVMKSGFRIDEKIYFVSFPLIKRDFIFSRKRKYR